MTQQPNQTEISVIGDLDQQIQQERQLLSPQRRGASQFVVFVTAVAVAAAGCAYLWLNDEASFRTHSSAARTVAPATSGEETRTLNDFQSFQSQIAESLQALARDIAAQKADIKNLSDQVSALAAKIDALQSELPNTGSVSVELPSGLQQPAILARPVVSVRKKSSTPKMRNSISVRSAVPPAHP
jgi:uncharacterized coiled-coil protein SlyX